MATSVPKLLPSQQAAVADVLAENEAKGTRTYTFNPDATTQEKAAIAGKAKSSLGLPPSLTKSDAAVGALSVPVVSGKDGPAVPTLTVTDADAESPPKEKVEEIATPEVAESDTPSIPGDLPTKPAFVIPDWYKVGWRAVSGIDNPLPDAVEVDKGIISSFIYEQYSGEWYHNSAVIVVAVVLTHLMTLIRMGWGWQLVLLAFCATYYSRSTERFRVRARDDMVRELSKKRLGDENESADWMNNFLRRFWLIYEPVLSETIVASVSQVLSNSTPAFLDSIKLSDFSLGNKAPYIDHVRTHTDTGDEEVLMEWGISFTPNDMTNITYGEAVYKTNPKILLEIRLGKGITAAMPILVEDITFKGEMKIKLKLMHTFPHIQIVEFCFMQPPVIDFVLKPIGGETFGMDISNVPGLFPFILDTIHSVLKPMMYDPNVFTLNLEQLMSGTPIDAAIGVLQVTIISGTGLKTTKLAGGNPDPYVNISINNDKILASTSWKENTGNPQWVETKFVLVQSLTGSLGLSVADYNEHRKDSSLGKATWDLSQLVEDATREGQTAKVYLGGKERGELKFDVSFYPVIKPEIVDGKPEPLPESSVGIARIVIHQAKELDSSGNTISKDLNPQAKLYLGSELIHTTTSSKHTLAPIWESPKEFLCSDRESAIVTIKVLDDRDFMKDPVVGYITAKLDTLLHSKKEGNDWFTLAGAKSGRIRVSTEWKPLDMAGSLHGAASYVPPIGIVRILMQKAVDIKNVEGGLGGKSDPYIRVMVNNTVMARTEVVNNNLNPVWNQYMYIPVHSLRESMLIECMDYQHMTKDRSLGTVELSITALAKESSNAKYPYESLGVQPEIQNIRIDSTNFKGELHYTAEFIPALKLKGVSFKKQKNELQKVIDGGNVSENDQEEASSSDEEFQKVAEGETVRAIPKKDKANGKEPIVKGAAGNGTAKPKVKEVKADGVSLTHEELLAQPAGIIVFDILSGVLAKKARLEILMDDGYWPVFGTQKARSLHADWDTVGEGFVKELDFGRVWLRLNENDEGEKESIVAEYKADAKNFLDQALNGETEFILQNIDGENTSRIRIAAKFVPVPITLSPAESINNQGKLRVEILDGSNIHGADRRGTSDPYVVVELNGEKVHKTEIKKKTLAPAWNESFECSLPNRVGADFVFEVLDWNQIERHDSLGLAKVDLSTLEPLVSTEKTISLSSAKLGDKGSIRVRLLFTPGIIQKSRKNTSLGASAGRAVTQIGAAPIGVGKGVIGGVGTAGKAVGGLFKRGGRGSVDEPPTLPTKDYSAIQNDAPAPTAFPRVPSGASFGGPASKASSFDSGTLRVTVQSGKDLADSDGDQIKPYALLTLAGKEQKTKHLAKSNSAEWDESFTFQAGPEVNTLHLGVFDYKTLGKDKLVGEVDIPIWQHIQPSTVSPVTSAVVNVDLSPGPGQVTVRLEYELGNPGMAASVSSLDRSPIGSPSRFSIRKKTSPYAE